MAVRILPNRTLDHPAVAPTTAPPAIRPPVERRRVLTAVGVPVLVFVMMRVVFSLATGTGLTDATPETWARYDSGHYRTIATEGYYVEPCAARGEVDITPTCSNAAWYPGYPLVSRAVSLVGMSWGTAAILIAQLATLGILLLIWNGFPCIASPQRPQRLILA
jgi:hypothetical protein